MNESAWEKFGQAARELIDGLTMQDGMGKTGKLGRRYPPQGYRMPGGTPEDYYLELPETTDVAGMFNQAADLKSGNLLVVHQGTNSVYQVDPTSERIEFLFQLRHVFEPFLWNASVGPDGLVYCTLGGTKFEHGPFKYAAGDDWGAIVRLDNKTGIIETLAIGEHLRCPAGLEFIGDDRLLICAPSGINKSGSIYIFDLKERRIIPILDGPPLVDPVTATMAGDSSIWIANSDQPNQDGELLLYRNGAVKVKIEKRGNGTGSLVGVLRTNRDDVIAVFRLDWPMLQASSVMLYDAESGQEIKTIASASKDSPAFYTDSGAMQGSILWFGEAYQRKIYGFDINADRFVKEIDFSSVLGGYVGMKNSYDGIENISVIP